MESIKMKVNIIVPVYNVKDYLKKCIDSILAQTHKNILIVLVDDGSTDNSSEICDAYEREYINVICIHQRNKGLAGARNAGINYVINNTKCANDAAIAFIDSDDSIHPEMIASLIQILERNEQVSVAGVDATTVYTSSRIDFAKVDTTKVEIIDYNEFAFRYLTHEASVSVCNKVFRLSLFNEMRFAEGRLNEDGLLLYELFLKYKCIYAHLSVPMYYYLMRDGSITNNGFGKNITDMVENFQKIEKLTLKYLPRLKKQANDNFLYGCAVFCAVMPISYYYNNKDRLPKFVRDEIKNRKKTINVAQISHRDKLILKFYAVTPLLSVTLFTIYRQIKKKTRTQK